MQRPSYQFSPTIFLFATRCVVAKVVRRHLHFPQDAVLFRARGASRSGLVVIRRKAYGFGVWVRVWVARLNTKNLQLIQELGFSGRTPWAPITDARPRSDGESVGVICLKKRVG